MAGLFRIGVGYSGYRGVLQFQDYGEWVLLAPEINQDWENYSRAFPPNIVGPHQFRVTTHSGYFLPDGMYPQMRWDGDAEIEYIGRNEAILTYSNGFPYADYNRNYDVYITATEKIFSFSDSAKLVETLYEEDTYNEIHEFFTTSQLSDCFKLLYIDSLVPISTEYGLEYRTKDVVALPVEEQGRTYTFRYTGPSEVTIDGTTYVIIGWNLPSVENRLLRQPVNDLNIYTFEQHYQTTNIFPIIMVKPDIGKGTLKMFDGISWNRV